MLNNQAATAIGFTTSSAYGGLLASDLDGSILPPAGSPNYVAGIDSNVIPQAAPCRSGSSCGLHDASEFDVWDGFARPDYNLAVPTYRWYLCNGQQNC